MSHDANSSGEELVTVRGKGEPAVALYAGRATVILGNSGSGKTRWLRRMIGLDKPASEVRFLEQKVDVAGRREMVGWVPDGDGVFLSQTVGENVNSQPHGPPVGPDVADDALELVGLAHRADDPVEHLTYNERRRVSLARAIALQRPILVVDGVLDPTITTFLPVLLVQAPWIRTAIFSSTVADGDVAAAVQVALVDEERVVGVGSLHELTESTDPTVKGALSWVMP